MSTRKTSESRNSQHRDPEGVGTGDWGWGGCGNEIGQKVPEGLSQPESI